MATDARAAILRRIRACLALADSPEPHEAAAAMRQAEALMRKHGLDRAAVDQSVVEERPASLGRGRLLPPYLMALSNMVGEVMGCVVYARAPHTAVFVGVGAAPEVAAYAYEVLGRQLLVGRALHRKRRTRGAAHKRTQRADAWAAGWVAGVRHLVEAIRPPIAAVIEQYMVERHPGLVEIRKRVVQLDRHACDGYLAGRASGVRLHPGVAPGQGQARLMGDG